MKWIAWLVGIVLTVTLTFHALPYVVRDQVVIWLRAQGVEDARFKALTVNWFSGEVIIEGLKARREGHYPLDIDRFRAAIDYGDLFDKKIHLLPLEVEGVRSGFVYTLEEQWLGPLNLAELMPPADETQEPETDENDAPSGWSVGLDALSLDNIDWRLQLFKQEHHLELDQLQLGGLFFWQPQEPTALILHGRINDAPFNIDSSALPLPADKRADLALKLENLPVHALVAQFVPQLESGTISADLKLGSELAGDSIHITPNGTISISDFSWQDENLSFKTPSLTFDGGVELSLQALSPANIAVGARVALAEGASLTQGTQQIDLGGLKWDGKVDLDLTREGPLNLGVAGSLDAQRLALAMTGETPLSLNFGQLGWQGDSDIQIGRDETLAVNVQGANRLQLADLALQQGDALSLGLASADWQGDTQVQVSGGETTKVDLQGQNKLALASLKLQQDDALSLGLASADWQGDTQVQVSSGEITKVDLQGQNKLALASLKLQQGSALSLALSKADLSTALTSEALNSWNLSGTQLNLSGIELNQGGAMQVALDNLTTSADASYAIDSGKLALTAPQLSLGAAKVQAGGKPLAALNSIQLNSLNVAMPLKVGLGSAQVSGLSLASTQAGDPLLSMAGISLNKLALDQAGVQIDAIEADGLNAALNLDEQMQPEDIQALQLQLASLSGADTQGGTDSGAEKQSAADPFHVRVGRIGLAGESHFKLSDRSVNPAYKMDMAINQLSLTNLDTQSSEQSEFGLSGVINRFAKLEAQGAVNLLASPRSGHWTVNLDDVQLPAVSPYSIKYTGYYLQSGQLNLAMEGTLDEDQLDGKNHIRINRLTVDPVDQEQIGEFQETISLPLETAISVLQDDDENIDLDVPISGSLNDPSFDYQSVINRVLGNSVKQGVMTYLVQALQPYGALITLAETAIDASKTGSFINLEPVAFAAGEAELSGDGGDYLDQLAGLMAERGGLRLNLCGVTVAADRQAVGEVQNVENGKRTKPLEGEELAAELSDLLRQLAQARSEVLKERLQQKVEADRLFLCYPQIDQDGEPRVDLSL
ncbi:DUF748 domain-containing protein [Marinobacterium lutimaris]|uniref:DUF748 domain-containing protein n=1 Tax=Marinobacterium lutimaris TaxID=568106 RepID=A0A1H6CZI2_9GAMM|nr:DUF748 domain-containing protein [Marinobacterium lutimaris]SEG78174.1 protein of unknown function [Marinobacterium lutimaris]